MSLACIEVKGFRNLQEALLRLDPKVNLLWGGNASGKTSLLEAIYTLARGRSFSHVPLNQLIQDGSDAFTLVGEVTRDLYNVRVGMKRIPGRTRVRLDGRNIARLSEVAQLLPIYVINTQSQRILTGGPKERRNLLDWGAFHVEQAYRDHWRRFQRALRQRNAALQSGNLKLVCAWEPDFVAAAEAIDAGRRSYLEALWPYWQSLVGQWLPGVELRWTLRSGWPQSRILQTLLEQTRIQEMERGHTVYGPHRADLRFVLGGVDAVQRLSRGQQKLAVIALRLAQADLTSQSSHQHPIILVDDLAAELHGCHRERVLNVLLRMDAQLLLTALHQHQLSLSCRLGRVFHVEQGRCREMV